MISTQVKGVKMSRSATIHATVDQPTKMKVQVILDNLGMSMSGAISVYFRQIVLHKGLPFEVEIPNKVTARTVSNIEKGINLHEASGVEEMIGELES